MVTNVVVAAVVVRDGELGARRISGERFGIDFGKRRRHGDQVVVPVVAGEGLGEAAQHPLDSPDGAVGVGAEVIVQPDRAHGGRRVQQ
jgi:hypothetical protein